MHTQSAYLYLVGNLSKFPAENAPNLPCGKNLQIVSTSVAAAVYRQEFRRITNFLPLITVHSFSTLTFIRILQSVYHLQYKQTFFLWADG